MDPFRRVRPGEAVRVSAIAWNAMLDLVRPRGQVSGGGSSEVQLPAQVATLVEGAISFGDTARTQGVFVGEAVVLGPHFNRDTATLPATVPLEDGLAFSETERRMFGGWQPRYTPMFPVNWNGREPSIDDRFAVCVDPVRQRFAIGGMAWVRVRALRRWHRFARRCLAQPGDGAAENAASMGCLDSCGWGPAEILGWAPVGYVPTSSFTLVDVPSSVPGTYWALIRF